MEINIKISLKPEVMVALLNATIFLAKVLH
jgi:hypothetical protein